MRNFCFRTLIAMVGFGLWLPGLNAQNFDYHREESMAVSWNGGGLADARSLATGGISFLSASAWNARFNPALIGGSESILAGMGLEMTSFQAYQYWGVNQGVLTAPDGLRESDFKISGLVITFPVRPFTLSMGWVLNGLLEFPDFDQDEYYWGYSGHFSGRSDHFFLAFASRPLKKLQLGIRLAYAMGRRSVDMIEHYYFEGDYYALIEQSEFHRSRALIGTLGLVYRPSSRLQVGFDLDLQLYGRVDRRVTRTFENNFSTAWIVQEDTARDEFSIPPRFRLSGRYDILNCPYQNTRRALIFGADLSTVWWSSYEYVFFGETREEDMRNTVSFALGLEYGLIGENAVDYFFRLGYRYDPQPVTNPRVTLHSVTGGIGIGFGRISLDLGMALAVAPVDPETQFHLVICGSMGYRISGGGGS